MKAAQLLPDHLHAGRPVPWSVRTFNRFWLMPVRRRRTCWSPEGGDKNAGLARQRVQAQVVRLPTWQQTGNERTA